jgi:hypothetical protein
MTVYQSLAKWLHGIFDDPANGFEPGLGVKVIDLALVPSLKTDFPDVRFQETALFSSPNDQHVQMVGGQYRHTEFKTWYLVRRFGGFEDRLSTEAFLEKIRRAIQRTTLKGIMPDDDRQWKSIEVNGGMFPSTKSPDNTMAVYQIPLKIEYIE